MFYIIPFVCFIVALVSAMAAIKMSKGRILLLLGAGIAAFMLWALLKGQQAQGWDGMGYAIAAFLMAGPALLGLMAGSILGLLRKRRAQSD